MATKKNTTPPSSKDPGRPISRPMAIVPPTNSNWGKTLTKPEWNKLMKRLDQKKKDREMSKLSDTLQRALDKKQGKTLPEAEETFGKDAKIKKIKTVPPTGKKPPTRSAGRGR